MSSVSYDIVVVSCIMVGSERLRVMTGELLFGGVLRPPRAINDFEALLIVPFFDGRL
jgi:hypothetical protein